MADVGQIGLILGSSDNSAVGTPANFRVTLSSPILLQGTWEVALLNCSHAKATVGNSIFVTASIVENQNVGSSSIRLLAKLPPTQASDPDVSYWELKTSLVPWRSVVTPLVTQVQIEIFESFQGRPIPSTHPSVVELILRPVKDA